ncbi:MAG: DUF3267 domain-containing protein [Rhodothermales bacterium]|nr:DUF3267 domain-containing protein [Rhodothermales bacterium]
MEPPADAPAREDRSVSMGEANFYAIVGVLPACTVLALAFVAVWGWGAFASGFAWLFDDLVRFLLLFTAGVLVHEGLHGLAWRLAGAPAGTVRFGFQWKTLTPYAHCTAPMPARAYRIGAAAPGVALGLLPAAVGLAVGGGAWMAFGLLFTLAAGGDALILWLLRGVAPERLVEDHPERAGCYLLPGRADEA